MRRRFERVDESIAHYLSQLETADRHGDAVPEASKFEKLKTRSFDVTQAARRR